MSLSMYQASIPPFIRGLTNLSAILHAAAAHAEAQKIDPATLVNARLAPDMFSLAGQMQGASDAAKAGAARLAGLLPPSYVDSETTLPELQERIAKTIAFLRSIAPEQVDGSEARTITLKLRGKQGSFLGAPYLQAFVLPNFYFHIAVAHAILRHKGVSIGKMDYLGELPVQPEADLIPA